MTFFAIAILVPISIICCQICLHETFLGHESIPNILLQTEWLHLDSILSKKVLFLSFLTKLTHCRSNLCLELLVHVRIEISKFFPFNLLNIFSVSFSRLTSLVDKIFAIRVFTIFIDLFLSFPDMPLLDLIVIETLGFLLGLQSLLYQYLIHLITLILPTRNICLLAR